MNKKWGASKKICPARFEMGILRREGGLAEKPTCVQDVGAQAKTRLEAQALL